MSARTPVTVIGGYLGAGKTTLVNHLLRHADGLRIAVLVNDFGALAIDADLIEAQSEDLISIAGGCVCCSFGSDLVGALVALCRTPPPDHVVIETSGVALPDMVARSAALIASFSVNGVVVLADAETVRERASDRYMGDTITRQLADADLVVLNKADLVSRTDLDAVETWVGRQAPRARSVGAVRADVPLNVLLGHWPREIGRSPLFASRELRNRDDASARYESASFVPPPLDTRRLAADLACETTGLIRAKGVLLDADGSMKTLHLVGRRYEIAPYTGPGMSPAGLICIGLKGRLDRAAIESALARAATPRGDP